MSKSVFIILYPSSNTVIVKRSLKSCWDFISENKYVEVYIDCTSDGKLKKVVLKNYVSLWRNFYVNRKVQVKYICKKQFIAEDMILTQQAVM